jgi:hypothetical protein
MTTAQSPTKFIIQEFREEPIDDPSVASNLVAEYSYDPAFSARSTRDVHRKQLFSRRPKSTTTSRKSSNTNNPSALWHWWGIQSISHIVWELFLPLGYPHTVNPGYLQYQFYDSVQGLCSYLRGVLCSAAVLEAAGVGDESKTAMAAALTWASRDGLAMIGGLVYSYFASPYFDGHVKEFRLFADIINDVGFALDMIAPWVSTTFASYNGLLWVSSLAVLCKTLCGISAGATKASITHHFAIDGNMADLNAKESTQETFVSLVGMLLGIGAAKVLQQYEQDEVDKKNRWNWILFVSLTILHVIANYKGVELLRMRTLNRARAEIVLQKVIQTIAARAIINGDANNDNQHPSLEEMILSPSQVHESLLCSAWYIVYSGPLRLGVPLMEILDADPEAVAPHLSSSSSKSHPNESLSQNYVITVKQTGASRHGITVLVTLLVGATHRDELQAFVHAQTILACYKALQNDDKRRNSATDWMTSANILIQSLFQDDDKLVTALRGKEWDVDGRFYLGFSRKRSRWLSVSTLEDSNENKKER